MCSVAHMHIMHTLPCAVSLVLLLRGGTAEVTVELLGMVLVSVLAASTLVVNTILMGMLMVDILLADTLLVSIAGRHAAVGMVVAIMILDSLGGHSGPRANSPRSLLRPHLIEARLGFCTVFFSLPDRGSRAHHSFFWAVQHGCKRLCMCYTISAGPTRWSPGTRVKFGPRRQLIFFYFFLAVPGRFSRRFPSVSRTDPSMVF